MGHAVLLRAMSGSKRGGVAVVFDGGFSSESVLPAFGLDVGAEELSDEPFLVSVDIADVG